MRRSSLALEKTLTHFRSLSIAKFAEPFNPANNRIIINRLKSIVSASVVLYSRTNGPSIAPRIKNTVVYRRTKSITWLALQNTPFCARDLAGVGHEKDFLY